METILIIQEWNKSIDDYSKLKQMGDVFHMEMIEGTVTKPVVLD